MADSARGSSNYAPPTKGSPAPVTGGFLARLSFRPRLWPTLAAALLVPLFLAAGQWQWNKASSKAALQAQLEVRNAGPAIAIPPTPVEAEALRFHRVAARGHYEPQFQILIDNRTHEGLAGYHIVTPLRLEGSEMRVLVNRGWVPVASDRAQLPTINTPSGLIDVEGLAIIPPSRFFTLAAPVAAEQADHSVWQALWQNLDLARYVKAVDFPVQPVVVQLDAQSDAGGFVRDWPQPDDRREVNLGYALQWWSFAATTVALWLVLNLRRTDGGGKRSKQTEQSGMNIPT